MNQFYSRYGWLVVLLFLLLLPAIGFSIARLPGTIHNDISDWVSESSRSWQEYQWFSERFGREDLVVVSWEGCTLDDPRLHRFADGVRRESGEHAWFQSVLTGSELLRDLESGAMGLAHREAIERLSGIIVGPDLQTTCVLVSLSAAGSANPGAAVERLYAIAYKTAGIARQQMRMGGTVVQTSAMTTVAGELYLITAISATVSLLIAYFSLGSVRLVVMLAVIGLTTSGLGMAVLYYFGPGLNILLMLLPAVWFVLATSSAVHFMHYYSQAIRRVGPVQAPALAVSLGWVPCALAMGTTACGFATLAVSAIPTVRWFGVFCAVGLLLGWGVLFLLLPAMLQYSPPRTGEPSPASGERQLAAGAIESTWRWLARFLRQQHGKLVLLFVVLSLMLGWGVARLQTSSANLQSIFRPEHRVVREQVWLEEQIGPLVPLEIAIVFPEACELTFPERVLLVAGVQTAIEDLELPAESFCGADLAPRHPAGGGIRQTVSRALWKKRMEACRGYLVDARYVCATAGEEAWRISLRIRDSRRKQDYRQIAGLLSERVRSAIVERLGRESDVRAVCTGWVVLGAEIQATLWRSLIGSLCLAVALIGGVMTLLQKSVLRGMLAMLPNLFPLVAGFGAMGWLGVPLDIGAMITGSIALGIAVDDTFHYLTWFERGRRLGRGPGASVYCAYQQCGLAMIQTSLICGCGLLVFMCSDYLPAVRFGALMCATLTLAVVADLLFLPALLLAVCGSGQRDEPGSGD